MKHLLLSILAISIATHAMEPSSLASSYTHKRKLSMVLSGDQAKTLHHKELSVRSSYNKFPVSDTPLLDTYKCAFILAALKPKAVLKLYEKIPHRMAPMLAQRKHMGKPLTLYQEMEVLEWQEELAQKYSPQKKSI